MIAIDTSALMALLLDEPQADAIEAELVKQRQVLISAGTLAEALIVAGQQRLNEELIQTLARLDVEVVAVDADAAKRIGAHYQRWGKGNHPARLNFGDCFAYDLARQRQCALLFVGNDFAQTDVTPAMV